MPRQLSISGYDDKKPVEVQVSKIGDDLTTTAKFINSSLSNEIFSFPINISSNLTTTNTNFTQINPFVIQFDNSSDSVQITLNMSVTATADGYIDIINDGTSLLNKPFLFSGTNKQIVNITRIFTIPAGSHTLKVMWKVSSGTLTLNSAGNNFIQAFNIY